MATSPTIDAQPLSENATGFALRSGCAAVISLVIAEQFHLAHADLAVWTTHMVMSQFEFTSFQKGVERVLGRGMGVFLGLVLLTLFRNTMYLGFVFECIALLVFFYVYFCKRLAYTFLNAGLYLALMMHLGRAAPDSAAPEGRQLFVAILLGVVVADLVLWISGSERDVSIQAGGDDIFPIDRQRLVQTLMLVATVVLSQLTVTYFDLPTSATLVSVMVLTIVPDMHQLLRKGELRMLGALLAMAYAMISFLILLRLPHFLLFCALLFVGSYLATYLARTGGSWAYTGVQMGLVLPMILVVPPHEFGLMTPAVQRLQGVVIALACSLFVGVVVAAFSRRQTAATT